MNIIYSGFIHPLIGVLSAFLILFGSEFVGKQLLKKIFNTFFFLNLAVGIIIISLIAYILILLEVSKITNPFIAYTLLFLGIYNLFFLLKNSNYRKINSIGILFILLIIFSLFILSITAPTMADSLDYHLGVPKYINQNHKWPNPNMWVHANISGLGEVYNSLGIVVYSDVIGSLAQFFSLASFLHYFSNIIKEINRIINKTEIKLIIDDILNTEKKYDIIIYDKHDINSSEMGKSLKFLLLEDGLLFCIRIQNIMIYFIYRLLSYFNLYQRRRRV